MSKIEIDSEELVRLKNNIAGLTRINKEQEVKLSSLDEYELTKKAVSFALRLADSYFVAVGQKLGFSECRFDVQGSYDINKLIAEFGKSWYRDENIKAEVSAVIAKEFSKIVLTLGIIPPAYRKEYKITLNTEL